MIYSYNGVKIFYNLKIGKGRPLIFLHGWGRSGSDFDKIATFFNDRTILTIDFPPFGKSQKTIEGWNIFTYVSMLMSLLDEQKIENADFIGHSFGGRILIILSAVKRSLVHSAVLVDSAGIKPRRSIAYKTKLLNYKLLKKMGFEQKSKGSADYQALSAEMKETFKSIVNTHLEEYAKRITSKTLIVWGKNDCETPLYMAKKLHKLIKNSQLEIIDNSGHFSFLDSPLQFFSIVNAFLKN